MNKEASKKAFREAEKELEEKQVEELKRVIKSTLLKIKDLDIKIDELQEEKKILKLDIEDFKEGRLDRIEERQKKDEKAQRISVVKVVKVKEVHHHHDRWYSPYQITWAIPYNPFDNTVYCGAGSSQTFGSTSGNSSADISFGGSSFTLNNSLAHNNVAGTYLVSNKTVHLR